MKELTDKQKAKLRYCINRVLWPSSRHNPVLSFDDIFVELYIRAPKLIKRGHFTYKKIQWLVHDLLREEYGHYYKKYELKTVKDMFKPNFKAKYDDVEHEGISFCDNLNDKIELNNIREFVQKKKGVFTSIERLVFNRYLDLNGEYGSLVKIAKDLRISDSFVLMVLKRTLKKIRIYFKEHEESLCLTKKAQ